MWKISESGRLVKSLIREIKGLNSSIGLGNGKGKNIGHNKRPCRCILGFGNLLKELLVRSLWFLSRQGSSGRMVIPFPCIGRQWRGQV